MIQTFELNSKVILISGIDPVIEYFVLKFDKPNSLWHRVGNGEIPITTLPDGQWKIIDRLRNLDVSTDEKFQRIEAFRKKVKELTKLMNEPTVENVIKFENLLIMERYDRITIESPK